MKLIPTKRVTKVNFIIGYKKKQLIEDDRGVEMLEYIFFMRLRDLEN